MVSHGSVHAGDFMCVFGLKNVTSESSSVCKIDQCNRIFNSLKSNNGIDRSCLGCV